MTGSETSSEVPVASAIWAVEQVAAELRETYLGVAAAAVLLERVGAGCTHPALRLARRSSGDALDLAGEVDQQVNDGVRRLRVTAGQQEPATIGGLVEVLDTVCGQWGAAADRVRQLPARVTAAGQQLRAAVPADDPTLSRHLPTSSQPRAAVHGDETATEATARQWQHAAEQLDLMAECLTSAVAALASYTDGLSGAVPRRARRGETT
ncbi:hypothetical protein ACIG87_16555 [Micromonospora sp. NPDC051925]|uniref:hypothetical protein n=1 Tax=Micromonospora sp. NPDC051925 TaxID=3364288 RepID=UPI0037C83E63